MARRFAVLTLSCTVAVIASGALGQVLKPTPAASARQISAPPLMSGPSHIAPPIYTREQRSAAVAKYLNTGLPLLLENVYAITPMSPTIFDAQGQLAAYSTYRDVAVVDTGNGVDLVVNQEQHPRGLVTFAVNPNLNVTANVEIAFRGLADKRYAFDCQFDGASVHYDVIARDGWNHLATGDAAPGDEKHIVFVTPPLKFPSRHSGTWDAVYVDLLVQPRYYRTSNNSPVYVAREFYGCDISPMNETVIGRTPPALQHPIIHPNVPKPFLPH